jgi:hypothetical protein
MAPPSGPPEYEQPRENEQISGGMEDAVPKSVQFKVLDRVDRIPRADHVMPLKKLMEHDPIEKTSEAQPEQQASRGRKSALWPDARHVTIKAAIIIAVAEISPTTVRPVAT